MQATGISFQVSYREDPVQVEVFNGGKAFLYRVHFPQGEAFFITKASTHSDDPFWTSIPEGKQRLAEIFGELIDEHYAKSGSPKTKPKTEKTPPPNPPTLF